MQVSVFPYFQHFLIGVGIPVVLYAANDTGMAILFTGAALTMVFTSIAFLASVSARDKAKGIGYALLLWFYFTLIYDGLVLLILFSFSDYPLEKFTLVISALNPIDLGRIFIMLKMDVSALMGYTGALYKDFFGSGTGLLFAIGVMALVGSASVMACFKKIQEKRLVNNFNST